MIFFLNFLSKNLLISNKQQIKENKTNFNLKFENIIKQLVILTVLSFEPSPFKQIISFI